MFGVGVELARNVKSNQAKDDDMQKSQLSRGEEEGLRMVLLMRQSFLKSLVSLPIFYHSKSSNLKLQIQIKTEVLFHD